MLNNFQKSLNFLLGEEKGFPHKNQMELYRIFLRIFLMDNVLKLCGGILKSLI